MVGMMSLAVAMELTDEHEIWLGKCLLTMPNTDAPKWVTVASFVHYAKIPHGDEKGGQ